MKKLANACSFGRDLYERGINYYRTAIIYRGKQQVGLLFTCDSDKGFESVLNDYSNIVELSSQLNCAPEIKRPTLLVYTKAELARMNKNKAVGLPVKATVRSYKGNVDIFYYANGELLAWDNIGGHSVASLDYYRKTKPVDKEQALAVIKRFNQHYNANLVFTSRLSH